MTIFTIIVESTFAIEICLSKTVNSINIDFLTEFWGDDFFHPVRDLKKIAIRYLK